jgi:starch phosphorylase
VFDPNALTLGLARRFTGYKRPALLLADSGRLVRILSDPARPVQLVVAGKAHPDDQEGRRAVRRWVEFASDPRVRSRVAFLEDYDLTMAEELVRGVDVWVNTPLPPWEACGTSGMKVLVNGGLNVSELDGWWAEAWSPEVGWALGARRKPGQPQSDRADAEELYDLLEEEVIPEFYARDATGLPRKWMQRVRASMCRLAPRFGADRMVRDYIERLHLPAATRFLERAKDGGAVGRELRAWEGRLAANWNDIRLGDMNVEREAEEWRFTVQVYLGEVSQSDVQVHLFADAVGELPTIRLDMAKVAHIPGAANAALYQARTPANRPAQDFTPRVVPWHPSALVPLESHGIQWGH